MKTVKNVARIICWLCVLLLIFGVVYKERLLTFFSIGTLNLIGFWTVIVWIFSYLIKLSSHEVLFGRQIEESRKSLEEVRRGYEEFLSMTFGLKTSGCCNKTASKAVTAFAITNHTATLTDFPTVVSLFIFSPPPTLV